jgi:cytochrome c
MRIKAGGRCRAYKGRRCIQPVSTLNPEGNPPMRIKTPLLGPALLAASTLGGATPALAQANIDAALSKAGCVACHAADKKLVGPSYKDISAKYKGKAGIEATLFEKVRKGGSGNFGPVPMTPNPPDKISDADLKAVVAWVLAR